FSTLRRPYTRPPHIELRRGPTFQHLVDQAVLHRLFAAHEIVTIGVTGDDVDGLVAVVGQDLVQALADGEDLPGVDLDVRGLALEAAQRLVDHHARMRQAVALARGAAGQQQGTHAAGLAYAVGGHVRLDELHGV